MFFLWYNISTFKGKDFFFKSVIFLLLLIITQLVVFLCFYIYNKKNISPCTTIIDQKSSIVKTNFCSVFFLFFFRGTKRRGQVGETNLLYYRQRSCVGSCAGRGALVPPNPQYFYYTTRSCVLSRDLAKLF